MQVSKSVRVALKWFYREILGRPAGESNPPTRKISAMVGLFLMATGCWDWNQQEPAAEWRGAQAGPARRPPVRVVHIE